MKRAYKLIAVINVLFISLSCISQEKEAELFSNLPEYCNTPDAMTMSPDGNAILLSVPNFNDTRYPGIIMKVNEHGDSNPFFPALVHPETGKGAPMGLEFGPDGNLYYADNQYFFDKNYKSRVIRIVFENNKPIKSEVVIENLKLANAVRWNGDYLYVSDTFFDIGDPSKEGWGGIYRVSLDEMSQGCVKLIADKSVDDSHLVVKAKCIPNHRGDNAGFDGMCFDGEGNLYSGNFGDGQFYRVTFDTKNGKVKEFKVIDKSLSCVDGICYDSKRDWIFITDSENNAIHIWDVAKEKMIKFSENGDTNGADGLMDQPCEPLIWNNNLIIANFDMPFPGLKNSAFDAPFTLSYIKLSENN